VIISCSSDPCSVNVLSISRLYYTWLSAFIQSCAKFSEVRRSQQTSMLHGLVRSMQAACTALPVAVSTSSCCFNHLGRHLSCPILLAWQVCPSPVARQKDHASLFGRTGFCSFPPCRLRCGGLMCASYFKTPLVSLLCSHHATEDAVASCGGDSQESVYKGHSQGGGAQTFRSSVCAT
jgi:hypothetical protein